MGSEVKREHIRINLEEEVQHKDKSAGFDEIELMYQALPEMNKEDVNLSTTFLGREFEFPFMVSGMTGGAPESAQINKDIAVACEDMGIGMGLGSIKAMILDKKLAPTYNVRDVAPDVFLVGNIGISHITEEFLPKLFDGLNELECDALVIHINAAQEIAQNEGGEFQGKLDAIRTAVKKVAAPVYVKEVGHGIDPLTAKRLASTGVRAIDVSGAGGTSWVGIETIRTNNPYSDVFWDFGIPTAASIAACKKFFGKEIIASGGVRNGLDVVKGLVLGARLGENANPILKAQKEGGKEGVKKYLEIMKEQIRSTMFLIGAKDVKELPMKPYLAFGKTKEWLDFVEKYH